MVSTLQEQLKVCPSCGAEDPSSKFCLSCGKSKLQETDDLPKNLEKPREHTQSKDIQTNIVKSEQNVRARQENSTIDNEPDFQVKENVVDLKKNINLTLWIVDLYLTGEVEEEGFNNLFGTYEYRFEQNMKRRNKMLEITRDIKPMKKAYTVAKLRISELELRRSIGDASDEEYNLKVPAYQWEINKYETELAKSKADVLFLQNFGCILEDEEGIKIKEKTENIKKRVEEEQKKGNLNNETGARIKKILDGILSDFKKSRKK